MRRRPFADTATIKAAIFDVIAQGRCQSDEYQNWQFGTGDHDHELRERVIFSDAVIRRISELQDLRTGEHQNK